MPRPADKEELKDDILKVLEHEDTDYVKIKEYDELRESAFDKDVAHSSTIIHHFRSWKIAMKKARGKKIEDNMKRKSFASTGIRERNKASEKKKPAGCAVKDCQWRRGIACLFPRCIKRHGWTEAEEG